MRPIAVVVIASMILAGGCKKEEPKGYFDSESGVNIPMGNANEPVSKSKKDPGEYALGWQEVIELAETMPKVERQRIYNWGLQRFSSSPDFLIFYGNRLDADGNDREGVEEYFKAALKLDPNNMNVLAVYGLFLIRHGEIDQGESYLKRVDLTKVWTNSDMVMTINFIQYTLGEPEGRNAAIHSLYGFLKAGQKVTRFSLVACVNRAVEKNHPEKEWLQRLADVCAGKAAFSTLDGWEAMKRATKV